MVGFNSSTASFGHMLQPSNTSYKHSKTRGELHFQLSDHAGTKILSRRQQLQPGNKCRGLLLPLASLTTLAQPFRQQQASGSKQTSSKEAESRPARRGSINIGLLLQPADLKQHTAGDEDNPTSQHHQHQRQHGQQQLALVSAAAASSQPHKARHKQHHQSPGQQQEACLLETASASSDSAQQSSQQQCKRQQGTSGSPIATWLACAARAKLLVAGAASAIVSRTAMAPLERIKMDLLLKTSSRSAVDTAVWVWQREGLAGFWKGNGLNLLRTAPFKVRQPASSLLASCACLRVPCCTRPGIRRSLIEGHCDNSFMLSESNALTVYKHTLLLTACCVSR